MNTSDSHLDPVLLSAYLDDEVTTQERDLVETHLVTCEACNLELESLSWTVNLLGQLPEVPPPRTFYITEAMLEPEGAPVLPWWDLRRWLWVPWTPVSAALAALLLVVIITQSTSLNLLPASPHSEIAAVGEGPIAPEAELTVVALAELSELSEDETLQTGTVLSAPVESPVAEFAATNPEDVAAKVPEPNKQTQPFVFVVLATALILLFSIGFVWFRRK